MLSLECWVQTQIYPYMCIGMYMCTVYTSHEVREQIIRQEKITLREGGERGQGNVCDMKTEQETRQTGGKPRAVMEKGKLEPNAVTSGQGSTCVQSQYLGGRGR